MRANQGAAPVPSPSLLPTKARTVLGWTPKVTFEALVEMMTKADLALAAAEAGSQVSR